MKRLLIIALALTISVVAQNIPCGSGFTASGSPCGLTFMGTPNGGSVQTESGGIITMMALNCDHCGANLWYGTTQNIQNFTTTFTFVPNDSSGLAFGVQNVTIPTSGTGLGLTAGASGEMGWSQFCCSGGPNNVFYVKFDRYYGNLTQIYIQMQCTSQMTGQGCNEGLPYSVINSLLPVQYSLSPINLASNAPYTASITYDGYNFCVTLTDSASNRYGPQCYKVDIPGIIGSNTAYVGFGTATGLPNTVSPTTLNSWTYTSGSNALKSTQLGGSFAGTMQ